jgi:hypothetical protein
MQQHQNNILHNDGANFHKKKEGAEADVMIWAEFNTGKHTLLRADKFLLRSLRATMKLELQEKKKWLQDVVRARLAWVAKQNEPPFFDVECQRMHTWRTGTHWTVTITQTVGHSSEGGALQNQMESEASNGIALHPNTAHRGQNRTAQQAKPGSTSNPTNQRSSGTAGAQASTEAPKRKRAQNPQGKKSSQGHSNQHKQETTEQREINPSQSFENPKASHMKNAQLMLPDQSIWCPTTGKCETECTVRSRKLDYLNYRGQAHGFWLRSSARKKGVAPKCA